MKGEMPLKRLSDDFVTLCDSLYTLCDSLCSSQDGHGHGLDVQIWLDDVRYLNVFSTSTWHIWHIIQCHSQYRSIIFDHSESFYFLRARGAMVFIFMQLLASILAALLALLTSGRHQNNIWDRDETILSIFLRAMYSWCRQECVRHIDLTRSSMVGQCLEENFHMMSGAMAPSGVRVLLQAGQSTESTECTECTASVSRVKWFEFVTFKFLTFRDLK